MPPAPPALPEEGDVEDPATPPSRGLAPLGALAPSSPTFNDDDSTVMSCVTGSESDDSIFEIQRRRRSLSKSLGSQLQPPLAALMPPSRTPSSQSSGKSLGGLMYSEQNLNPDDEFGVQLAVDHVDYVVNTFAFGGLLGSCGSSNPSRSKKHDASLRLSIQASKDAPHPSARRILANVAGIHEPGRLLSIMGPSGAGKTTLLNIIGGNLRPSCGQVRLNGEAATPEQISEISGFVHQDDCLLATMTVRETVLFAARMRLPASMSSSKCVSRTNNAIRLLGLARCQHTIIGSAVDGTRGVSGGEKKRCAIAAELITNPSIIFLDEPSSGLDAYAAYSLGCVLQKLCQLGKTVALTIHQPSSDLYNLFDDLLLLAGGAVVYWGPAHASVAYFGRLGYHCPQFCNPCDYYFLHVLNAPDKIASLHGAWHASKMHEDLESSFGARMKQNGIEELVASKQKSCVSPAKKIALLTSRGFQNFFRNKMLLPARLIQALITAAVAIAMFWDVSENQTGIMARSGALFYFASGVLFTSVLSVLSAFSSERPVFLREHSNGTYAVGAYFCSKVLVEYPFQIAIPMLISLSSYFAIGLQPTCEKFAVFSCALILMNLCGSNIGLALSSLFSDISIALSLAPLFVVPLMLFSGFFISYEDTPPYIAWIQAISPVRYSFAILMQNEFSDLQLHCTPQQMLSAAEGMHVCPIEQGSTYITLYGYDSLSIQQCFVVLCILTVATLLIALGTLYVTACRARGTAFLCGFVSLA